MPVLYHASTEIVKSPVHTKSRKNCDFGLGFYMHVNEQLAIKWAYSKMMQNKLSLGFVNSYQFIDNSESSKFRFNASDLLDFKWLDFILYNRGYKDYVNAKNLDFISKMDADIIIGPIANQTLGAVFNNFLQGIYGHPYSYDTKELLLKHIINPKMFQNQLCFKTAFALSSISYLENNEYLQKDVDKYVNS